MKCRIFIFLLCAFVVFSSMAQTEHADSIEESR